jgi:hypothetical protein
LSTAIDPTRQILGALLAVSRTTKLGGRRLTEREQRNLEIFFGRKLAMGKVRVHAHVVPGEFAVCIDNRVFFPRCRYREDFGIERPDDPASSSDGDKMDLAWLVHECCHAWQFQAKVGRYRWYKALLEHIQYGAAVYDYDINEKDCLTDYRFEQQGQIVQDYAWLYLRAGHHPGGALADRYRMVIACSLPVPHAVTAPPMRKRSLPDWRRELTTY